VIYSAIDKKPWVSRLDKRDVLQRLPTGMKKAEELTEVIVAELIFLTCSFLFPVGL
jgi:hypothetical protein